MPAVGPPGVGGSPGSVRSARQLRRGLDRPSSSRIGAHASGLRLVLRDRAVTVEVAGHMSNVCPRVWRPNGVCPSGPSRPTQLLRGDVSLRATSVRLAREAILPPHDRCPDLANPQLQAFALADSPRACSGESKGVIGNEFQHRGI